MTYKKEQKKSKKKKEMLGKKQHFANILETPPKFHKSCFQGSSCLIKWGSDPPGSPVVRTLLKRYWKVDMQPKYLRDSCGIWTGRRQFRVLLGSDSTDG